MTPREGLRIGDAERDAAMEFLREHYAQGRLTREELDERLELVLSARTGGDLAVVEADLPALTGPGAHGAEGTPGGAGDGVGPWDRARGPWSHAWSHAWPHADPRGHGRGPGGLGPREGREARPHRHPWGDHHPTAWERRGGRPFFPVPVLLLLLVGAVAFTGLGVLKVLLAVALVMTVMGALRHGRGQRRGRSRERSGIAPPGAF